MDAGMKHQIGYWMTVLGFAMVISGGLLYSFITLDAEIGTLMAVIGFLMFLLGAELALRNAEHSHESD